MEATFSASMSNTVKFYYSKRKSNIGLETSRSVLGRQTLIPPLCTDNFQVGAFYEIDHGKLPPKSPIQLKSLRVVKVIEITALDLAVSFPSILSLRNHFLGRQNGDDIPELDEKFVMSYNYAGKALRRMVSLSEFEAEKKLQSFWLVAPLLPPEVDEAKKPMSAAVSGCLMALKSSGLLEWGVRRRVKYIGRHRETPPVSVVKKHEEDEVMGEEKLSTGERKRTRDGSRRDRGKKKKKDEKKKSKKKPRVEIKVKTEDASPARSSKDRWSTDRYQSAELKLLDIMREKGAEIGCPILRPELRVEARKHIGDTGLLDHLLKHMAGKVIGQGSDRFQRRHNADGAMEYWLEPAELMEIRKAAGVLDPFWVPPPGWKLGDATSLCICGTECKRETNLLKEEVIRLGRDMDQLRSLKQQLLKERTDAQSALAADKGCQDWQERYEKLLNFNAKMEAEMAALASSVERLKEEVKELKELKEEKENREKAIEVVNAETECLDKKVLIETNASANDSSTTAEESLRQVANKKGPGVRRSGFRICKPQGTFLWPNMGGSSTGPVSISRNGLVVPSSSSLHHYQQQQKQLMLFGGGCSASTTAAAAAGVPTPLSASSTATSPPNKLFLVPSPTTPTSTPPFLVSPPHALALAESDERAEDAAVGRSNTDIRTELALATPSTYA